jgi:hypothetical protein
MARTSDARRVVEVLLDRHGRTYAEELAIRLEGGGPSVLFRLLCAALLFSTRIRAQVAVAAARALAEQGWTTAEKLAGASWQARARTLNEAGYARYDERTATMLGDTATLLLEDYGGDLRRLREHAGRDPGRERALLKRFKGMGDVGVDIFFREAQATWGELRPFLDRRALEAARRLRLGDDVGAVAGLVPEHEVARLAAALVRARLAGDEDDLLAAAADPPR